MSDFTLHSFNKITKDSWKQEVGNTNFQNGLIIVIKYRLIYLSSGYEKILNKEKFPSLKNCVENEEMIFCYQNCSDLLWEKIVLVIGKNFWNSRLKAENSQNVWDH